MEDLKARLEEIRSTLDLTEVFDDVASEANCCGEMERASQ